MTSLAALTTRTPVEQREQWSAILDAQTRALPAYDRHGACPMCDFDRCTTRYRPKELRRYSLIDVWAPVHREALERACPNCRYTWDERPLTLRCAEPSDWISWKAPA